MNKAQKTKDIDYIKQLEEENRLLKERLLQNILNENTEIVRLTFERDTLKRLLASK